MSPSRSRLKQLIREIIGGQSRFLVVLEKQKIENLVTTGKLVWAKER